MLGVTPLFRLSKPKDRFLYTTSIVEAYDAVANQEYTLDGEAGYVFPTPVFGLTPLYQLGKKDRSDYLFTTSLAEVYHAIAEFGYEGQGIAGHVLGAQYPGTMPLYRLSRAA